MLRGVRWLSTGPGSGMGDASERYISGLRDLGVPVSWSPLGWPSDLWQTAYGPRRELSDRERAEALHAELVGRPVDHDTVVVCSTPFWDEHLSNEARGCRLVAYTSWETDRLPAASVEILGHYDAVLVPSSFCAEVFAASGVTVPLAVVPHAATTAPPAPRRSSRDRFTFYLISTWTTRKAIGDAVEAYLSAFRAEEDVALVIHTTPEDQIRKGRVTRHGEPVPKWAQPSWLSLARLLREREPCPKIVLSTDRLDERGIASLHSEFDCFYSLSRGEGWGLGAFDAAAFGNPVVVTGWGGVLDFLPEDYPYLVGHELISTASEEPDAWWTPHPGERWARADLESAAQTLRRVFADRDESSRWGERLRHHVTSGFDSAAVTRRLLDVLSAVPSAR